MFVWIRLCFVSTLFKPHSLPTHMDGSHGRPGGVAAGAGAGGGAAGQGGGRGAGGEREGGADGGLETRQSNSLLPRALLTSLSV